MSVETAIVAEEWNELIASKYSKIYLEPIGGLSLRLHVVVLLEKSKTTSAQINTTIGKNLWWKFVVRKNKYLEFIEEFMRNYERKCRKVLQYRHALSFYFVDVHDSKQSF